MPLPPQPHAAGLASVGKPDPIPRRKSAAVGTGGVAAAQHDDLLATAAAAAAAAAAVHAPHQSQPLAASPAKDRAAAPQPPTALGAYHHVDGDWMGGGEGGGNDGGLAHHGQGPPASPAGVEVAHIDLLALSDEEGAAEHGDSAAAESRDGDQAPQPTRSLGGRVSGGIDVDEGAAGDMHVADLAGSTSRTAAPLAHAGDSAASGFAGAGASLRRSAGVSGPEVVPLPAFVDAHDPRRVLVSLDVILDGVLRGTVPLHRSDNAYSVATKFCVKHRLPPVHVMPLAKVMEARIAEALDVERRAEAAARRAASLRLAEEYRSRITLPTPFKLTAGAGEGGWDTHHFARSAANGLSAAPGEGGGHAGKAADAGGGDAVATPPRAGEPANPLIARMQIQLGPARSGTLVIHALDDAEAVVAQFVHTYAVRDPAVVAYLRLLVTKHLQRGTAVAADGVSAGGTPPQASHRTPSPHQPRRPATSRSPPPPALLAGAAHGAGGRGEARFMQLTESQSGRRSLSPDPAARTATAPAAAQPRGRGGAGSVLAKTASDAIAKAKARRQALAASEAAAERHRIRKLIGPRAAHMALAAAGSAGGDAALQGHAEAMRHPDGAYGGPGGGGEEWHDGAPAAVEGGWGDEGGWTDGHPGGAVDVDAGAVVPDYATNGSGIARMPSASTFGQAHLFTQPLSPQPAADGFAPLSAPPAAAPAAAPEMPSPELRRIATASGIAFDKLTSSQRNLLQATLAPAGGATMRTAASSASMLGAAALAPPPPAPSLHLQPTASSASLRRGDGLGVRPAAGAGGGLAAWTEVTTPRSADTHSVISVPLSQGGGAAMDAALDLPLPAPAPAPAMAAAPVPTAKPLFNLDVDIGGGRKGRIVVTEGADAAALAGAFVDAHGLSQHLLPRLVGLIDSSRAAHVGAAAAAVPPAVDFTTTPLAGAASAAPAWPAATSADGDVGDIAGGGFAPAPALRRAGTAPAPRLGAAVPTGDGRGAAPVTARAAPTQPSAAANGGMRRSATALPSHGPAAVVGAPGLGGRGGLTARDLMTREFR
jgi:hypothetical protein